MTRLRRAKREGVARAYQRTANPRSRVSAKLLGDASSGNQPKRSGLYVNVWRIARCCWPCAVSRTSCRTATCSAMK